MSAPARATVALLWLSLATAGAVLCHLIVGTSYGPYAQYAHVGLGPVSVIAVSLLVTISLAAWADSRPCAIGRRVWFVRGAMTALATPSRRHVFNVLFLQLGVTFALEEIEHIFATGDPCAGFAWLALSPLLALTLQALVAVLAVTVLRSFLRGVVEGCDALLRLALAVLCAVLKRSETRLAGSSGSSIEPFGSYGLAIARHRALRAPPTILRSAT